MTLPTELIFPSDWNELVSGDPIRLTQYLKELTRVLTTMYENIVQNVNGDIREFAPEVFGNTSAGAGTYSLQEGWYLRQGLMVDYWYAVGWTNHTGTGQAYIQLPYKVKKTNSTPFVGQVHGQYNYAATHSNMFSLAESDGFKNLLYADGPANVAVAALQVLTFGIMYGHVRYIGQEFE